MSASAQAKPTPTPPAKERIRLLDILRGVAVFGTLGTNVWLFSTVGSGEALLFGGGIPWWTSANDFLAALTLFVTNGKFLGMLTILFGVGLEIQYQSARRRGLRWPVRYLWRSALLFVEGFLHFVLVFEFDILMGYAAAAFVVAFLVGGSERTIRRAMWITGGIHVAFFGTVSALVGALIVFDPQALAGSGVYDETAARVYAQGAWWDQVFYRLNNALLYRLEPILIIPMNVFLFLLGARLMRSGAFSPDEGGRLVRRRMLRRGLVVGVPLNLLYFVPGGLFELPVRYLFAPILSLGYIGLVALAAERRAFSLLGARLADVGRMALSCYVLQNVLASVVFYGWGLGLTGRVGSFGTLAIASGICAALMLFSHVWLGRFASGPLETAWRRLSLLPFGKDEKR